MSAPINLGANFLKVPSAARSATTDNYVSSQDVHKPAIGDKLIKRYGIQRISDLLEANGRMIPVAQTEFSHYEEAFIHSAFQAQTATAPVSGYAATTYTIPAGYIDSSSGDDYPFVRIGDIVMFGVNKQLALVTATPSASTFTCVPYKPWSFNAASNGVDINVIVVGREAAEGADGPSQFLTPRVHKYTNNVMIIDDAYKVTGSEATNMTWFEVQGADGKTGYLWYLKGEADTSNRFDDYAEMQMLVGKTADSGGAGAQDVRGTEGLIGFIENRGQTMNLSGSPITMADFDAAVKSLDKYRGAKENSLWAGINLRNDIDDMLAGMNSYGANGQSYGAFNNSKDMALELGFQSFQRLGYTFHTKTYDLFNHPQLLGAPGFDYNGWGMVIPMDMQKDARSGDSIPSLSVRYKAADGYSRQREHWLTGGAVIQNKTNREDALYCNYRTERGFEGFAPNRFMLIKK